MTTKRVVLSVQARRELKQTTAWYRQDGGPPLARRWAAAVQHALNHLGTHPQSGSARYASELKLEGLRCWPIKGFPYLVFYIERGQQIDVGRVLHTKQDIPEWMGKG